MNRCKPIVSFPFVLAVLAASGASARAGMVPIPPPGPARVASADAVVVGKVQGIEPEDVKVGTTNYRIAVVAIEDGIKGANGKTIRVGFIPVEKPQPGVFVSGARPLQLEVGTNGLFILAKQGKETFYTVRGVFGYFINRDQNKDFDKEVQYAKTAIKLAADPQAALQSNNAGNRLLAAAILIDQHRTFRGPNSKQQPIDAEESKKILQVLVDADWTAPINFASLQPAPSQLFQQLGVTKADGFAPPPGGNYQAAIQAWLRDNVQKYRIQRFVAADSK